MTTEERLLFDPTPVAHGPAGQPTSPSALVILATRLIGG